MQYRREIDGLRALAVVPVILFHAGLPGVSGGYVGVDVFFVISGYLITGIIARDLAQGRFSIARFYERRARRILPALLAMMALTALAAVVVMLPYELVRFGQGALGVAGFVSNVVFWRQTGYFADTAETNPLLHTWSLSVEEQFYVVIPLGMLVLWRWGGARSVIWLMALGALLSLGLAQELSVRAPSANFYLLPTRAWELLAGGILALLTAGRPAAQTPLRGALALAGIAAIVLSVGLFSPATPFPSLWGLVPVLGTLAILYGATEGTLAARLLSHPVPVGIGLISYSAYLWHQPLLAFARMLAPDGHPPLALMLGLAGLSLGLAWLSWAWIERPFRQPGHLSRATIFRASGLGLGLVAALGAGAIVTAGLPQRFDAAQRDWVAQGPAHYAPYVTRAHARIEGRERSPDQPNLLLVGDSFSQDMTNIVQEGALFPDHALSALYIPARCQLHYGQPYAQIAPMIAPQDRHLCQSHQLSPAQMDRLRGVDTVILAFRWQPWAAERLPQTLRAMGLPRAGQTLFVLGPKAFESNRRALLRLDPATAAQYRQPPPPDVQAVNEALKSGLDSGVFVDVLGTVCAQGCPLFTPQGALISYDGLHLTQAGAQYIATRLRDSGAFEAAR